MWTTYQTYVPKFLSKNIFRGKKTLHCKLKCNNLCLYITLFTCFSALYDNFISSLVVNPNLAMFFTFLFFFFLDMKCMVLVSMFLIYKRCVYQKYVKRTWKKTIFCKRESSNNNLCDRNSMLWMRTLD